MSDSQEPVEGAEVPSRLRRELALAGFLAVIGALLVCGLLTLGKVDSSESLTRSAARSLRKRGIRDYPRPIVPILVVSPGLAVFALVAAVNGARRWRRNP